MFEKKLDIGDREEQQDNCDVFVKDHQVLMVLGDGMGGHKGGAIASELLVREAGMAFLSKLKPKLLMETIVQNTIEQMKLKKENDPNINPHTTCVMALINGKKLYFGHIGDSRLYYFKDSKFVKRTKDHSVVQMLVNMGEIEEHEMATHPDQNKLLKSLGTEKDVEITYAEESLDLSKNFAVLICSDGFWEYVSPKEMQEYLFTMDLDKALKVMVGIAKKRGGEGGDNISVAAYMHTPGGANDVSVLDKVKSFLSKELW